LSTNDSKTRYANVVVRQKTVPPAAEQFGTTSRALTNAALSSPINPTLFWLGLIVLFRSVSRCHVRAAAGQQGGTRSCAVWLVAVFRFGRDTRITKRLAEISL